MSAGYGVHLEFASEGRAAPCEAIYHAAHTARLQVEILKQMDALK